MILDLSQNRIAFVLELSENGGAYLKHFSLTNEDSTLNNGKTWTVLTDLHLTGEDSNDHHGFKHTGNSTAIGM